MSLTLNKVPDEVVGQHTTYQEGRLAKLLGEPEGSRIRSNPVRYANSLAAISFDLGMGYYQQERPVEQIKERLAFAAQNLVEAITQRTPSGTEMWQPTEYEKALGLAYCFGPAESLQKLLGATDAQIMSQPDPKNASLYENSYRYCRIVRDYIAGKPLVGDEIQKCVAACQQSSAWKFDRVNTLSKLQAMQAIEQRASDQFQRAIKTLVSDHQNESLHGELQKLTDANIAIPILLLAKLGKAKANLTPGVNSPYLPEQMI